MNHTMTKYKFLHIAYAVCMALALASCGTSRKATGETSATPSAQEGTAFSAADHLARIAARRCHEKNVTAKLHVQIAMGDKRMSTSGTLRMRRDDVIQLSVVDPILGVAELMKAEFTRERVLILDRLNKHYIDVPYKDISFLRRADLDFTTLQSLFWNEVFLPGEDTPTASAFTFTNPQGETPSRTDDVWLDHTSSALHYRFVTRQADGSLRSTRITSAKGDEAQFQFDYDDFQHFKGGEFPRQMVLRFTLGTQQASLTLDLSSLRNDSDWTTRTQVPSRYSKADAEKMMRSMIR